MNLIGVALLTCENVCNIDIAYPNIVNWPYLMLNICQSFTHQYFNHLTELWLHTINRVFVFLYFHEIYQLNICILISQIPLDYQIKKLMVLLYVWQTKEVHISQYKFTNLQLQFVKILRISVEI